MYIWFTIAIVHNSGCSLAADDAITKINCHYIYHGGGGHGLQGLGDCANVSGDVIARHHAEDGGGADCVVLMAHSLLFYAYFNTIITEINDY